MKLPEWRLEGGLGAWVRGRDRATRNADDTWTLTRDGAVVGSYATLGSACAASDGMGL